MTQFIKMTPELEALHTYEETRLRMLLRAVISLLPREVQEFCRDNIRFIFTYSVASYTGKKTIAGRSVVTILNMIMDLPESDQIKIITHEVAHAVLEHSRKSSKIDWDHEAEADKLCRKWLEG